MVSRMQVSGALRDDSICCHCMVKGGAKNGGAKNGGVFYRFLHTLNAVEKKGIVI
jgi:hypothetical protein